MSHNPPPDAMKLIWANATYAAINIYSDTPESFWNNFVKTILEMPMWACYSSGWCYGHDENFFTNSTGIYEA